MTLGSMLLFQKMGFKIFSVGILSVLNNEQKQFEIHEKSELRISESSDWNLFEKVAEILRFQLDGEWLQTLDAVEQRYWDLKVGDDVATLHLEHYLGITVFSNSRNLLFRIKQVIEENKLV